MSENKGKTAEAEATAAAAAAAAAPPAAEEEEPPKPNLLVEGLACLHQEYCADSIEFCPFDPYRSLFACANYQLKETREKVGRVYMMNVGPKPVDETAEESDANAGGLQMTEVFRRDTGAIFDLKWSFQKMNGKPLLGQVCASSLLQLYTLEKEGEGDVSLAPLASVPLSEDGGMGLSLDWNDRLVPQEERLVAVSQSDRVLSVWSVGEAGMDAKASWEAHEHEMWIVAFNSWDPNVMFSGADDCKMKGWDLRIGGVCPIWTNARSHTMGVCTIQSHPTQQHVFASGSYDENVRVWDARSTKKPLFEQATGAGVWRVKWHPTKTWDILAASMHNGFHVISMDAENGEGDTPPTIKGGQIRCSNYDHKSLAYGVDWCQDQTNFPDLVASCSFYDKELRLWRALE